MVDWAGQHSLYLLNLPSASLYRVIQAQNTGLARKPEELCRTGSWNSRNGKLETHHLAICHMRLATVMGSEDYFLAIASPPAEIQGFLAKNYYLLTKSIL
jgi:hypothetical protein